MAFKDKAQMIRYNNQFSRDAYDRIGLMVPKGQKAEIQAAAKLEGKSVNRYIQDAIAAYVQMKRNEQAGTP